MNDKNSIPLIVLSVLLAVILGFTWFSFFNPSAYPSNVGGGFSIDRGFGITYTPNGLEVFSSRDPNATSTVAYLAADTHTASTTVKGFIGRAESYDVDLIWVASSTSAILLWTNYFSNNNYATTSDYWAAEDCNTATSNVLITHGSGSCVHTWTADIEGINTKRITVDSVQGNYLLMKFQTHTASSSLNVFVIPKEPTPN